MQPVPPAVLSAELRRDAEPGSTSGQLKLRQLSSEISEKEIELQASRSREEAARSREEQLRQKQRDDRSPSEESRAHEQTLVRCG